MWGHFRSAVLLAAACVPAAAVAVPAIGPSSDELQRTLARPRLDYCDELVCYYRARRDYAVRGLSCEVAEERRVVCLYERTAFDLMDVTVTVSGTPPPAPAPEWTPAETKLERLGQQWIIIADSDD